MNVTINEQKLETEDRITIYEAAKRLEIKIPTLCHNDKLTPYAGCRVCLVQASMQRNPDRSWLVPSCSAFIEDGLVVRTESEKVRDARIFIMELFLARCPDSEEIQAMARELGVPLEDESALGVVGTYLLKRAPRIDPTLCILCGLCVRACGQVPERHAIHFVGRGMRRRVKTPFDKISDTRIGCGSCAYVCPTNAITIEEA